MTDMGRRRGDMQKSVYDQDDDGVADGAGAHKISHQNAGADEVSVAGLSGELADDQPPKTHDIGGAKHAASSLALVNAKISDATLDDSSDPRTPDAHKTTHENGGDDEIDCSGLAGTGGAGLLVDGVSGRVLRAMFFVINNGSNASTVKARSGNLWNGHTVAEQDNIEKDAITGVWSLSANGSQLHIETAGLGVNALWCAAHVRSNTTNINFRCAGRVQANRIRLEFYDWMTSSTQDITLAVDTGEISVDVLYITDA